MCITEQLYRVVKHYFDEHTDHLKVEKNDVVRVINRTNNGLLWVQLKDEAGWIPETHLEKAIADNVPFNSRIASKSVKLNQEIKTKTENKQVSLQRPSPNKPQTAPKPVYRTIGMTNENSPFVGQGTNNPLTVSKTVDTKSETMNQSSPDYVQGTRRT
ncbi:uncharacterized protein LOC143052003 [Mytilus galloprovincialis]|uniref:uncharacterized protein LOC143052003 n=1 Tax=Mytilus galloprovincialis TaxID=29158 RepID=UPI003F7C3F70